MYIKRLKKILKLLSKENQFGVKELVSDLSLDDKGWLQPLNSEDNSDLNESLILEGENVG